MKRVVSLLVIFIVVLMAKAASYKILRLNHPQIFVNGKLAKVGDVFNDQAVIRWTKERQAMQVVDTSSKKRYLMVSKSSEKKELTALEILTRINHLSTHAPGDDVEPFDKLEMSIAPTYDLLDQVTIPTSITVNNTHYFRATYQYGDASVTKRLKYENGCIVIDKSLFHLDNKILEPRDIILSIDYVVKSPANAVFIKDNIEIKIIPEILE
jgi:hypothetical protein